MRPLLFKAGNCYYLYVMATPNVKVWFRYLQEERDAAYLYRILASKTPAQAEKARYEKLGHIEDKHAEAWQKMIRDQSEKVPSMRISGKAKLMAKLTNLFGAGWLRELMLREEGSEVKTYLNLYKESGHAATQDIALTLARDSATHAQQLGDIMDRDNEPWHKTESGGMLRNVVYGFNDGLTANFGLLAGMLGAEVNSHFVLISGLAGTIADSLSMAASGYLAAKSEQEVYENERRMEAEEIKYMPDLEREELSLIYQSRGMSQEQAEHLAKEVMKDPERALEEKVREELGIGEQQISPMKEAVYTGTATAIGAIIPVIPFFFGSSMTVVWTSFALAMFTHFLVGAARSIFTGRKLMRSGFDMFIVGFGVAIVGYLLGMIVQQYL